MLKRITDRNIWVIYGAIVLLGIAYGTSIAVLAVHLKAIHIPKLAMGGLAAAFALGIVAFSLPAGLLVQRVGAKATFVGALAGYAICVTTFPFMTSLAGLSAARFFDGVFSVGIWVSAETALLARSDKENKGLVMSLYAISIAIGYVIGPLIAKVVVDGYGTRTAFLVAGGIASLAVAFVVVALDKGKGLDEHPADKVDASTPSSARSTVAMILWRTKTSLFGTFAYGYFQSSVVLFLPLYLIEVKGVPEGRTILVTAFFAGGMLSMSLWAGRLGDRYGYLLVMRILATIGATMVASFVYLPSFPFMCAAVFVAGATLASISPVSLALQGVVTPRAELGRANGFYNAAYAVGMLVGPSISSVIFTKWGGGPMLFHLAALWASFVLVTLVFAADDPRHATSGRALRAMLR